MDKTIGTKIKQLRIQRGYTLKQMSEKTNLSTGFLSQLERGLTSVATDSLEKIAKTLDVDVTYFFIKPNNRNEIVLRRYEKEVFEVINGAFINYHLSSHLKDKLLLPRLIEILPNNSKEDIHTYVHHGEEFVYVLEGTLTLFVDNERIDLSPGDSAHYNSEKHAHNWSNYTSKIVKLLVVSGPNPYSEKEFNLDL